MNNNNSTFVTSYYDPDLDGTACAFAYAEYLNKTGKDVLCAISGTPHKEALFVLKTFAIKNPVQAEGLLGQETHVILVDASDLYGISKNIIPENVTEIIDHRKVNQSEKFPNARIQIEFVGAAATLIAEKFHNTKTEISHDSAALLYSAIVSNTINFQATVTTDRDKKMAEWLLTCIKLPKNYIHDMFAHKSEFTEPLKEVLMHDMGWLELKNKKVGIFQLEIINVKKLFDEKKAEIIDALKDLQSHLKSDYNFLTAIDIELAENSFIALDKETEQILEQALDIHFENGIAVRKGIIMRKTIIPMLKEYLEK